MKGLNMKYVPRDSTNLDNLFGEDNQSTFTAAVELEMYFNEMTGFGGESDIFSRFGLNINDEGTFIISYSRFKDVVTAAYPLINRPREGDLIYFDLPTSVFEIAWVEDEKPFYQNGILTIWTCHCKKFEYNHDIMESGVDNVDDIVLDPVRTADNDDIQTESDTFVNFDENDPFSDNSY